jgi:hypothetical protein
VWGRERLARGPRATWDFSHWPGHLPGWFGLFLRPVVPCLYARRFALKHSLRGARSFNGGPSVILTHRSPPPGPPCALPPSNRWPGTPAHYDHYSQLLRKKQKRAPVSRGAFKPAAARLFSADFDAIRSSVIASSTRGRLRNVPRKTAGRGSRDMGIPTSARGAKNAALKINEPCRLGGGDG